MPEITLQVGVKALLKNQQGKYLLIRRSREKYSDVKGEWDIVGGRIEPGASLLENLDREIKEEIGLKIIGEPQLIAAQDILRVPGRHVVRLTYVGSIEGQPILNNESVEYGWFGLSEMKANADLDIYLKELLNKGIVRILKQ